MMLTAEQAAAVVRRYPNTVQLYDGDDLAEIGGGIVLADQDNGALYRPANVRDALGWIAAGEWDNDGTNPRTTRLAKWWHRQGRQKGEPIEESA